VFYCLLTVCSFFFFFCLFNFFFFFGGAGFQLDFLFPSRPIDGFDTSRTRVPVELCRCNTLGKRMTTRVSSIRIGEKEKKDEIIKTVLSDMCVSTALLHQAHVHISFDLFSPESIFFLYISCKFPGFFSSLIFFCL
jgi:hypothetical protein